LALASLVCGIVALGLALVPIESHKYSGFFLFGWVPAIAEIFIASFWRSNPDKRISRIGNYALLLGLLGFAAAMWASGYGRAGPNPAP
jgi:hypothetical protein